MRIYLDDNRLRMVGKSWQIRAKLKELSQSSLTVQQYLQLGKVRKRINTSLRSLDKSWQTQLQRQPLESMQDHP